MSRETEYVDKVVFTYPAVLEARQPDSRNPGVANPVVLTPKKYIPYQG